MKKKTKADILEARSKAVAERQEILTNAQNEKRTLKEDELQKVRSLGTEIVSLDAELDALILEERLAGGKQEPVQELGGSNIAKILREALNGNKFSDESRALMDEGRKAHSAVNANISNESIVVPFTRAAFTVTADGEKLVATEKKQVLSPLYPAMVLREAGATFLDGLRGDIEIPAYSGTTSAWASEDGVAQDGKGSFTSVKLSPKRLTTTVTISKKLLLQDSVGAAEMINRSIFDSIAQKLESTILGSEAGSADKPAGLLNGTIANKGAVTYKRLIDMEAEAEAKGFGNDKLVYITNPKGRAVLRSTLKDKTTGAGNFITDGKEINGIKLLSTANVAGKVNTDEDGLLLGDFSNLIIGQWGGLDLTSDPYTEAKKGAIVLTINTYFDAVVQREGSIIKASIKA